MFPDRDSVDAKISAMDPISASCQKEKQGIVATDSLDRCWDGHSVALNLNQTG